MTTYDKPKVTVIISTYNRPQYLAEAIESVVNQHYQNWELLIFNDGGVDVAEVVDKFADPRIIYTHDTVNRAKPYRCNQGMAMARGEYIAYLDDDDKYYPNHLEVLSKALDDNPEVALAYSDLYGVSSVSDLSTGRRYQLDKRISVSRGFNREFMFHHNHVLHVSLMHRLDAAQRVGGFDENVKVLVEWSLNRRLAFLYDFVHVEVPTGEYHLPVFKSDRLSVRERRSGESYKHNLRKIRCHLPAEPWSKVDRIDLIYVVEQWGEQLNQHLRDIIDNFDHPFYITLVNNGTGLSMDEIRQSLGNLLELRNVSIRDIRQKEPHLMAVRRAAKKSKAKFLFLVTPKFAAVKYPHRLFPAIQYLNENPEHQALRWDVEEEEGHHFNLIITRDYFLKSSRPGKSSSITLQQINLTLAKGFEFDAMYSNLKKLKAQKKWDDCRKIADNIMNLKEGVPHIQYMIHQLAPICLGQNDYDTLEKDLRDLIARGYRPDNLIRLGVMLGHAGRWPEAVETLKEALAAHDLKEEDFEAGCFPFALKQKLSVFYLLMALGDSYLAINDSAQAAKYYRLASRIQGNGHEPFLGFAKVWLHCGQLDRAEAALHKLPGKAGKDDPETHRLLGMLCQRRRNLDLAFQCFQRAFEVGPADSKNVDPFYFVGAALGKWEEMYEPMAKFCHENPRHTMGLVRLTAICFNLNSDALAADMAERCLELDPGNAIARSIQKRLKAKALKAEAVSDFSSLQFDLSAGLMSLRSQAPLVETGVSLNPESVSDLGGLQLDIDSAPMSW